MQFKPLAAFIIFPGIKQGADGESTLDSPQLYPPGYEPTGDANEDCEVSEAWERELAEKEVCWLADS